MKCYERQILEENLLMKLERNLSEMGLGLGMHIDNWPPENIENLAKQIEDPY